MASDTDKKGLSWFKGVLSQNHLDKSRTERQEITTEIMKEEPSENEEEKLPIKDSNNQLFAKDNQDKIALDVIVSIENVLKERQLLTYKNKGLEDQLNSANEMIHRLKQDLQQKEQLIQEKNNEIHELENSLTNNQMSYDQLLEDYQEYQLTSKMEYGKISDQLETETTKYNKLNEELKNVQYQNMLRISDLEEKIRSLETESQKYAEQYQNIVDEKAQLMQTINDFTERMSFSFSPKSIASSQSEEK